MTRRTTHSVLLVAGVILLPAIAYTQAPQEGRTTHDVLFREVRLLRLAIERQSMVSARAQLLVGRLALQDQRFARSSATVARVEEQSSSAGTVLSAIHRDLGRLRRTIDSATDPSVREAAEQELRGTQQRLADHSAESRAIQTRLTEARQAAEADRAGYEDLEAALNRLDRELEPAQR
jgi:chromosome segregation ATPase